MNEKKAKKLRRKISKEVHPPSGYRVTKDREIVCVGYRGAYRRAKKCSL